MQPVDLGNPSCCTQAPVLGSTLELFTLPDNLADGWKAFAGLAGPDAFSHRGFIDPGFSGHITLELSNRRQPADHFVARRKIGQFVHVAPTSRLSIPAAVPRAGAEILRSARAHAVALSYRTY